MRFSEIFAPKHDHAFLSPRSAWGLLVAAAMAWTPPGALAQTGVRTNPPPSSPAILAGPNWQELTAGQQKILQPLAGTWNSLMPERKSKWLAMAHNYPSLGPAEQAKLQSRMAEWAALNPQQRERARLNFAETKKLAPTERSADWEAYQALSPEEKQKLAERARAKLPGAAIAPKPVAPNTLTAVPLTRRTTELNKPAVAAKPALDRNTLLPVAPRPTPGASAPTAQ